MFKEKILIYTGIFTASLLLLLLSFHDVILDYYPSGDEISLITKSAKSFGANPAEWFTNGFFAYFAPYPEWTNFSKTILRPVVNFVFYLNDFLFRDNYGMYLIFIFAVHSLLCVFAYILTVKYLKMKIAFGLIASALMFANPSVLNPDFFFHPGFAFDAAAAIFFFICFIVVQNRRKYFFLIFAFPLLLLALFTKEISMLLPFLLSVTLYFQFKDKKKSILYIASPMIILLVYLLLRYSLGFAIFSDSSLDHLESITAFAAVIFKGLFVYPSGFYSLYEISGLLKSFYFDAVVILISLFIIVLPGVLNLGIIVILFIKRKFTAGKENFNSYRILLYWTAAIFLYLVFMKLDLRFANTLYLFFIPAVLYLLQINSKIKIFVKAFLIFFLLISIIKSITILTVYKEENTAKYHFSRQLCDEIKKIPNDNSIVLINDVSALFGSEMLNEFCMKKNEIIKINSLRFFPVNHRDKPALEVKAVKDSVLKISINNIGPDFLFEGVNNKFNHKPKEKFERNDTVAYRFPHEQIEKISGSDKINIYRFGTKFEIEINTKADVNIIYFDTVEEKYRLLEY